MVIGDDQASYFIADGDIPCTPEVERTYSFVWNFCGDVTAASFPPVCNPSQMGSALQYYHRASDDYKECNIIGHYDPERDDTYYHLLDERDPSRGISMTYLYGDRCPSGKLRTTTIDVQCANVELKVESALEPLACEYHMVMKSWHGCPQSCPVSSAGLCSAHGHCAYDKADKTAHCYCNAGYGGADCSQKQTAATASSAHAVQMGLLVTLLVVAVVLVGVVGYLAYRVTQFRKEQAPSYSFLQTTEMVERVI